MLKPSTRTLISRTRSWDSAHNSRNCGRGVASGTVSPDGSLNVSLHGLEIGKAPPAVVEADNVSSIAATTVWKVPFHDRFALRPPELVAGLLS